MIFDVCPYELFNVKRFAMALPEVIEFDAKFRCFTVEFGTLTIVWNLAMLPLVNAGLKVTRVWAMWRFETDPPWFAV